MYQVRRVGRADELVRRENGATRTSEDNTEPSRQGRIIRQGGIFV